MQPPKAKNPVVGPVHSERGFPFTARPLGRAQLLDPTLLRHRGDGAALAPDAPIRVANMIVEGRESMPNVFGHGRTRPTGFTTIQFGGMQGDKVVLLRGGVMHDDEQHCQLSSRQWYLTLQEAVLWQKLAPEYKIGATVRAIGGPLHCEGDGSASFRSEATATSRHFPPP